MSLSPASPLPPYPDFASASRAAVEFLTGEIPMAIWSVNRAEGELMVILQSSGPNPYGIQPGSAMAYAETLCARMVAGLAPNMAPDVSEHPAYRDAPVRQLAPVNTYVSFPLLRADGGLFGTLCGFDPEARPPSLLQHRALIALLTRQLATILQFDLERENAWRLALQHEARAMTDALTGIGNRRAFELCCQREEARCRDIGQRLSVIAVDLDGLKAVNDGEGHAAGDALLRQAATQLRDGLRADDHIARIGGDEFVVLLPGCGRADAERVVDHLRSRLASAGLSASFGHAERKPHKDLVEALARADAAMYQEKARRKAADARPAGQSSASLPGLEG